MASTLLDGPALVALFESLSVEERASILTSLSVGLKNFGQRFEDAVAAANSAATVDAKFMKKTAVAPKASRPAPVTVVLPDADSGIPSAADYRVAPADIDHTVCVGRILKGGDDKRWKPVIFRERQCRAPLVEGSDLCVTCCRRLEKYAAEPKPGDWTGKVTEDPEDWVHMLGTAWAEKKPPKWIGCGDSDASDSGSVASMSSDKMSAAASVDKKADAEKKAADRAVKAAEKAAALQAKAEAAAAKKLEAEKKAADRVALAEKKAAEKAAKEAAKAEKKPKAPAAGKKSKAAAAAVASDTVVPEAAASIEEPVIAAPGMAICIAGEMYWKINDNLYEYDELKESGGDYVGRYVDDNTIDTDAPEVTDSAESDSD